MTATATSAPSTPSDGLADPLRRGLVPSTCPAWKSFITSPASPHATATTPATKKQLHLRHVGHGRHGQRAR